MKIVLAFSYPNSIKEIIESPYYLDYDDEKELERVCKRYFEYNTARIEIDTNKSTGRLMEIWEE